MIHKLESQNTNHKSLNQTLIDDGPSNRFTFIVLLMQNQCISFINILGKQRMEAGESVGEKNNRYDK